MAARLRPIKLILASASPRRRLLLKKLRIPFRVIVSNVSEATREKNPVRFVRELALRKARHVAKTLIRPPGVGRVRVLVLGADTVVVLRGKILGKPKDVRHAVQMLGQLSGSTNRVYTGVALVDADTGESKVSHAVSVVRMKRIAQKEIARLSRKHLDKAGSYAIQEKRDPIARLVKGSYDNVVGLPVSTVRALLKTLSQAV